MTDEGSRRLSPACLDERGSAGLSEKTHRRAGKANNPFRTKGALIHPYGRVRSAEGLSPHREERFSPAPTLAALPQQGAAPCAASRLSLTPTKQYTRRWRLYHFAGFIILSGR